MSCRMASRSLLVGYFSWLFLSERDFMNSFDAYSLSINYLICRSLLTSNNSLILYYYTTVIRCINKSVMSVFIYKGKQRAEGVHAILMVEGPGDEPTSPLLFPIEDIAHQGL